MNKKIKSFIVGLLVGALLMVTTSSFASLIKEFVLVRGEYHIIVNDNLYQGDLPILNFEGSTYVPLRSISDLLGAHVFWNEGLRQVEITYGMPPLENEAFRNIIVSGSQGNYRVAGEARVFEATVQYEVEDGHYILLEGFETASEGGPGWGIFMIDIDIPEQNLPQNGVVMLTLFAESAENGSRINEMQILLETFYD